MLSIFSTEVSRKKSISVRIVKIGSRELQFTLLLDHVHLVINTGYVGTCINTTNLEWA